MTNLKIERDDNGQWLLLMPCADGIDDVLSEHETKAEAVAEKRRQIDEARACDGAERHYQAQYAYACGYLD